MLTPGQPLTYNNIELVWQWDEDETDVRQVTSGGTRYRFNTSKYPSTNFTEGYWSGNNIISSVHQQAANNLFTSNDTFTADQQMTVDVIFNVWFHQRLVGTIATIKDVQTKCLTNATSLGPVPSGGHQLGQDTITQFGNSCAGSRLHLNLI